MGIISTTEAYCLADGQTWGTHLTDLACYYEQDPRILPRARGREEPSEPPGPTPGGRLEQVAHSGRKKLGGG